MQVNELIGFTLCISFFGFIIWCVNQAHKVNERVTEEQRKEVDCITPTDEK